MTTTEKKQQGDTMRSCVHIGYNDDYSKVMIFDPEFPKAPHRDGEVYVQVSMTASNPVDYKLVDGTLENLHKLPLPVPLGRDFAGIVASIDGVPSGQLQGLKVGDRVCGFVALGEHLDKGSFAEFVSVKPHTLCKVPEAISLGQAAALPLVANTTFQALHEVVKLVKGGGQKVLILGGSTATGMLALQMCRDYGCKEVVCTSSSVEMCRANGATEVYNYRAPGAGKWEVDLADKQFDIVYDCVGGHEQWSGAQCVMRKGGQFVTIVGDHHGKFTMGALLATGGRLVRRKFRQTFGPKHFAYHQRTNLSGDSNRGLRYFVNLVHERNFSTIDSKVAPFEFSAEGAVAMFKKQVSGSCKGKLLMHVWTPPGENPDQEAVGGAAVGGLDETRSFVGAQKA